MCILMLNTIDNLSGIADGLKALARAVQEAPGALKAAYQAGFLDGALAAAVVVLLLLILTRRTS